MIDTAHVLCFVVLVISLGGCLIRAFFELQSIRQRRVRRGLTVRDALHMGRPVVRRRK
jgi:hypothetical protein